MYSNCLIFAYHRKFKYGGSVKWSKSRTWKGFHTTWVDLNGEEWEFTQSKLTKHSMWYIPLLYKGIVRKVNESKNRKVH